MNFIDDFNRLKNNKMFHTIAVIGIVLILLIISAFIMLRYQVEGEDDKNLPFILSKIIVISSAEGINNDGTDTKWVLNLIQNNDIYISVDKNEQYKKSEVIKSLSIQNIIVDKSPAIGNINNYRPATEGLFQNEEQYIIKDELKYLGSTETKIGELQIGNQGGTILFRSSNTNIGNYKSNDEEIVHNGTLLAKAGITNEQINYSIKFDLIIEVGSGIKYKGTVNMNLPEGDILGKGITSIEKTNFDDVIFKRI